MKRRLILVLGDQLTPGRGALRDADPKRDVIVMAEVREEATYVRHNRHKIALVFAAMRHFADEMRCEGFRVLYYRYDQGLKTLRDAVTSALAQSGAAELLYCEPAEHRLRQTMARWRLPVSTTEIADDRFLVSHETFDEWAAGRKSLRMEYFYRDVRRQYGILVDDDDKPEGGRWNFDADNRQGWRGDTPIPERPVPDIDETTREVLQLVDDAFPDNPGDLASFNYATTRQGAQTQFQWFIKHGLPRFGQFQDAMAEASPWLFHSVVSMYINIGLLDPLAVCTAVEDAYRDGRCELAAAEGFIRQVAGWREYVRGIYWREMPDYARHNVLKARRQLPEWFWTGEVELQCLSVALRQSLDLGYAHHIQRLMIIGNFSLLAGLDVEEVCAWYLAVYADAFEWVELPNTLGMALHADGGLMASKPYAASGKYIQRQGDHCSNCAFSPNKLTGEGACPYNSLYWRFIARHAERWSSNPRMALPLRNWQRKAPDEQEAILRWADSSLRALCR